VDTLKQKISHLQALFHLACADRELSQIEITYIRIVAEHLGVNVEQLKGFDPSEPVLVLPDREYKIYGLFHRLAIIMMIDNQIDEKEKRYCFNLGVKMGLHPNAVSEIIEHAIVHGSAGTKPEDVMRIFKKYLN